MAGILVLSGGLDSTVLLHELLHRKIKPLALSFRYGQTNPVELEYALRSCKRLKVPWQVVDITGLITLNNGTIKNRRFGRPRRRQVEHVPNRNMIFISIAAAKAISIGEKDIYFGFHAPPIGGTVYPDCTPEFVQSLDAALYYCDLKALYLKAPFLKKTKGQLIRRGKQLGVDFSSSWTCLRSGEVHCGTCSSCVDRLMAFEEAGVEDTAEYKNKEYWKRFRK